MKKLYFILPVLLLSYSTGAQINIQSLVNLVDCSNFSCISDLTQSKGYNFADSTYDADFRTSRYIFEHKPFKSVSGSSNILTLEHDAIAGQTVISFETLAEDYYRTLLNDITAIGFQSYHTYSSGDVVYSYPTTKMVISVNVDTYDDGLHYVFTINYKPGIVNNTSE